VLGPGDQVGQTAFRHNGIPFHKDDFTIEAMFLDLVQETQDIGPQALMKVAAAIVVPGGDNDAQVGLALGFSGHGVCDEREVQDGDPAVAGPALAKGPSMATS
jgi:hypothetical protein